MLFEIHGKFNVMYLGMIKIKRSRGEMRERERERDRVRDGERDFFDAAFSTMVVTKNKGGGGICSQTPFNKQLKYM